MHIEIQPILLVIQGHIFWGHTTSHFLGIFLRHHEIPWGCSGVYNQHSRFAVAENGDAHRMSQNRNMGDSNVWRNCNVKVKMRLLTMDFLFGYPKPTGWTCWYQLGCHFGSCFFGTPYLRKYPHGGFELVKLKVFWSKCQSCWWVRRIGSSKCTNPCFCRSKSQCLCCVDP